MKILCTESAVPGVDMLIDLKGINVFLLVLFIITDSSRLSEQIEITRGDQDIFDNPKCSGGAGCNCDGLRAFCVIGSCARCKCKSQYKTFLSSIGDHGRCVKDYYILFLPDVRNSSFLVEEKHKKKCIGRYSNGHLGTTDCNLMDSSQRWIWTYYNQLLLVDAFECLTEKLAPGLDKHNSALGECEPKESKQRWKCDGNVFRAETSNRFMCYGRRYIVVSNDSQKFPGFLWHRFQSNKSLCSKAFGCYEFANSSSTIFVLNTNCKDQCQGNRVINIPYQSRQSKCNSFIVEEKLQFWDYNDWKQLAVIEKPFWITKTNNDTSLQWDLSRASQKWNGLIVRLRFYCTQGLTTPPPQDTSCIVIKFEGVCHKTTSPPPSPDVTSSENPTDTKNPTDGSTQEETKTKTSSSRTKFLMSSSLSANRTFSRKQDVTSSENPTHTKNPNNGSTQEETKTKTSSLQTKFLMSSSLSANRTFSRKQVEEGSSNVVIIVVCVVIIPLVIFGVLGIFFYMRRRRSIKRSPVSVDYELSVDGATRRKPSAGDTVNPTYSPAGNSEIYQEPDDPGFSQECELYEPGDTPIYHYAKVEQETKPSPSLEATYDYASNDEIRPAAQRLPVKSEDTNLYSNDYSDAPTSKQEDKEKNGQNNPSPVYHTLDES